MGSFLELQSMLPKNSDSSKELRGVRRQSTEWLDPASEQQNAFCSARPEPSNDIDENAALVTMRSVVLLQTTFVRDIGFLLLCLLSGGAVALISYWNNRCYATLRFTRIEVGDKSATHALVESLDHTFTVCTLETACLSGGPRGATWKSASQLWGSWSSSPASNRDGPRTFVWRNERFWQQGRTWHRQRLSLKRSYLELQHLAAQNALQVDPAGQGIAVCTKQATRWLTYGDNVLTVVVTPFIILLVLEFFKPFFIFQALAIIIWMLQRYIVYAYVVIALTLSSALFNALEAWRNLRAIQKLASSDCTVTRMIALCNGSGKTPQMRLETSQSSQLLPGDVIEVVPDMVFPCDCILLTGQAVVNESMLTGESAPVLKSSLPLHSPEAGGGHYDPTSDRDLKYRLLSGTKVVQVKRPSAPSQASGSSNSSSSVWDFEAPSSKDGRRRMPVLALVGTTGYNTAKGQLVRAILYPKEVKLDFERKMYYFMVNLLLYLLAAIVATVIIQRKTNTTGAIILNCLNLMTIAIPPALPLALSIGLSVSFTRLQTKKVFCIAPPRIVNAGRVNTACFDKTGTLTEDGLSLRGVCPVREAGTGLMLADIHTDVQKLYFESHQAYSARPPSHVPSSRLALCYVLAACHGLSLLESKDEDTPATSSDRDGGSGWRGWKAKLGLDAEMAFQRHSDAEQAENERHKSEAAVPSFVGDPLEVQMFAQTGWTFSVRPEDPRPPAPSSVWCHPALPASCDTVLIPQHDEDELNRPALAVLRRFDFDNELRMMSVLAMQLPTSTQGESGRDAMLLAKGAPESIKARCTPASLPADFEPQLWALALNGDRVLACAFRPFPSATSALDSLARLPRADVERELVFAGFLVMENKLKPETAGVLLQLTAAGLRQIMVTGDNPLTAIAVARKCGPFFLRPSRRTLLLDVAAEHDARSSSGSGCILRDVDGSSVLDLDTHWASVDSGDVEQGVAAEAVGLDVVVTGRAFQTLHQHHRHARLEAAPSTSTQQGARVVPPGTAPGMGALTPSPFESVLTRANIFARMSPQDKVDLVVALMDLGYTVCMTGDGANDSMALKAADVGISIASKAVEEDSVNAAPSIAAPFSTKLAHIGAVPIVLAEGRSAMVTASSMFKYMFTYGLIQTTSVIIVYRLQLELYQYMYLWADLALVFPMVVLIPSSLPRSDLTRGKPESDLLARSVIVSVYGHSLILIGFQLLANEYLHAQSWYQQPTPKSDKFNSQHNENSTESWLFSTFQYIFLAWTFSQSFGKFRAPLLSNRALCFTSAIQLVVSTLFVLIPTHGIRKTFGMVDFSEHRSYLVGLLFLALLNGSVHLLFERFAVLHQSIEPDPIDPKPILEDVKAQQYGSSSTKASQQSSCLKNCWTQGGNCIPTGPSKIARYRMVMEQTSPIWAALR